MYTQYFSLASTLIKRVHHLISCTAPAKTQKAILSPQCGGKIAFGFGGDEGRLPNRDVPGLNSRSWTAGSSSGLLPKPAGAGRTVKDSDGLSLRLPDRPQLSQSGR